MNAPDRIWAGPRGAYWSTEDIGVGTDTEYVRADIAADLLAALEEANRLLGDIPAAKNNPRVADAIQANRRAMAKARGAP